MSKLGNFWETINGNKTAIGVVLMILLKGVTAVFPSLMSAELADYINDILLALTGGIGVGHKIVKSYGKN